MADGIIFFQSTSSSPLGVPRASKNLKGPTELDFKGFGCNHEVLKELEANNLSKVAKGLISLAVAGPREIFKKHLIEKEEQPSFSKRNSTHFGEVSTL